MTNSSHIFNRTFVRLLAAAVVAGYTLQTEWAINHDFEYFDVRVFGTALILFILAQGVRVACRRWVPGANASLEDKYSESVLLLSVMPAFFIVENAFLRTAGLLLYAALVVRYASTVLEVKWLRRLLARVGAPVASLARVAAEAPLSYRVEDDVNGNENRLLVLVSTRRGVELDVSELQRRVDRLRGDLPPVSGFDEVEINVDGVARVDGTLVSLLEPVYEYAALGGIQRVAVSSREERMEEVASALPADRFTVQASPGL